MTKPFKKAPAPKLDAESLISTRIIVVPQGMKVAHMGSDDEKVQAASTAIDELRRRDYEAYVALWRLFLRIQTSLDWSENYSLNGRYFVRYQFVVRYTGHNMIWTRNRVIPEVAVALNHIAKTEGVPEAILLWENLPFKYRLKVRIWQSVQAVWSFMQRAHEASANKRNRTNNK